MNASEWVEQVLLPALSLRTDIEDVSPALALGSETWDVTMKDGSVVAVTVDGDGE